MQYQHPKKKKINVSNIIIIILIIISGYLGFVNYNDEFSNIFFHSEQIPTEDSIELQTYFCQSENCSLILENEIKKSKNVSCAFYDLELENIKQALVKTNARLIIDNEYKEEIVGYDINSKSDWNGYYMHNKFCVLDNYKVITGSMNPTINGAFKNDNNLVIITSKILANNYLEEFNEMFLNNHYHYKNAPEVSDPVILDRKKGIALENYFCPEDNCEEKVITILSEANTSIKFLLFSFTSDTIGSLLVSKSKTLEVEGILEARQNKNSQYSEYDTLINNNISVLFDANGQSMHHKVFIVDSKTVITGSYNPTNNGNHNNDENILIIHNKDVASKFIQEYNRIKELAIIS